MKKQTLIKGPFLFLWLAQIFSQLVFNMVNFVLLILVFEQTSKNTAVAGLVFSFTLPALLFGMLAGVYVDRRDKKNILLLTNIVRAFLVILLFFVKENIFLIFVLSFFISTATQFFVPAEASSIPRIVGKNLLITANSLFTITLYSSIFAGYLMAGPALKFLGFGNTFLLSSALYFLAAFFITLLPSLGKEKTVAIGDLLSNGAVEKAVIKIREVYKLMLKIRNIFFAIIFLTISQGLITVLGTLLPGYAKTVLGIEPTDISLIILAPATLGMIIGSIFLVNFGKKLPGKTLANVGILVSGIILLILSGISRFTSPSKIFELDIIHLVVILLFIAGLANAMIVVISNTTIQSDTEEHMVGGVYGVVVALSAALALFPVIVAGGVADILGVRTVLTIIGILIVLFGIFKTFKDYAL